MSRIFAQPISRQTLVIAANASVSSPANVGNQRPIAIVMPAAWDAAVLSAQVSSDGGTNWENVYTRYAEWSHDMAGAGRRLLLDPWDVFTWDCFRLRSGLSGTPVLQSAQRSLVVLFAP